MVTNIDLVRLKDFGGMSEEKSAYKEKTFVINCQAGEAKTQHKISFPYAVSFLSGVLHKENVLSGNHAVSYIQVKPNGIMGVLLFDAAAGENILSSEIPVSLFPGVSVCLSSDPENEYEVKSHNQENNTIEIFETIENGVNKDDFVIVKFYNIDRKLFPGEDVNFAENSFGSKIMTPNLELVIEYDHGSPLIASKEIYFLLRYFYGELDDA